MVQIMLIVVLIKADADIMLMENLYIIDRFYLRFLVLGIISLFIIDFCIRTKLSSKNTEFIKHPQPLLYKSKQFLIGISIMQITFWASKIINVVNSLLSYFIEKPYWGDYYDPLLKCAPRLPSYEEILLAASAIAFFIINIVVILSLIRNKQYVKKIAILSNILQVILIFLFYYFFHQDYDDNILSFFVLYNKLLAILLLSFLGFLLAIFLKLKMESQAMGIAEFHK